MAGRRCPGERCPVILTDGSRYCPTHARAYEQRRGTSAARGYGSGHRALRASWQRRIDAGERIACARCTGLIVAGQAWALDHHDDDRSEYLGPSHASCNNAAGGRRGGQARRQA